MIKLPVKTIVLFGLFPHNSMKWITSPNLRLGWPANITQGWRYSALNASSWRFLKLFNLPHFTSWPCGNGSSGRYTRFCLLVESHSAICKIKHFFFQLVQSNCPRLECYLQCWHKLKTSLLQEKQNTLVRIPNRWFPSDQRDTPGGRKLKGKIRNKKSSLLIIFVPHLFHRMENQRFTKSSCKTISEID